jgi:hypothetical protein
MGAIMPRSRFLSASLLIATCLSFASSAALAQGIPPEAYRAKSIFIRNNAGGAPLKLLTRS